MADEKRRAGRDLPFLNWRYILFTWNDSDDGDGRGAAAGGARSASIACAGSSPTIPEDAFSRRFVPGTPDLDAIAHEIWDDNNLGNAIPGATPRARIDVAHRSWPRRAADRAAAGEPLPGHGRASRTCRRVRSRRRPPTAAAWSGSARSSAPPTARSSTATSRARGCRRPLGRRRHGRHPDRRCPRRARRAATR